MEKSKIIGLLVVLSFFSVIAYFFLSTGTAKNEIPPYVTGELREIYDWARTPQGGALLEQVPCYCGCKFEGHKHTRHCYWNDDGGFDKHGITCSTCFDIATKTKKMHENGSDICQIIKEVDEFYKPNANLRTDTPIPERCKA